MQVPWNEYILIWMGDFNYNVPIYKRYKTNNVFYSGTDDKQMITSVYESFDE